MKNVLITGASRGIGRAIALRFARESFRIFINCKNSLEELSKVKSEINSLITAAAEHSGRLLLAPPCEMLPGDVGNPNDVRRMFEEINQKCGGIDILINNAGIAHIGLLSDMTDEEWNQIIQSNLSSVFYCSRAAVPHMVSQKSGKIINISSIWGSIGASCEAAYSASKSGVNGLTKALAKELAPSNIQINAVACGAIDTIMNSMLSEEERKELEQDIPAGRFGTCEEVAELVYGIAVNHNYMTGQVVGLDGGWV